MSCALADDGATFTGKMNYVQAVEAAGGSVLVVPPRQGEAAMAQFVALADCILLPGGGDLDPAHFGEEALPANGRVEPDVDAVDLYLARHALRNGIPVLGICRGCQVLAVAAGGKLIQDLPSQWPQPRLLQHSQQAPRWHASHQVAIEPDSLLAAILGETTLRVNSFHHQAVRSVPEGVRITARAADGVSEAIEFPGHPWALGVQWHPEGMVTRHPLQRRLFSAFVVAGTRVRTGEKRMSG
jgi:putative glutamine amidotransferase